ncbi:hypothetical protein GB931_15055 [Modestobacter sp. I12A-02628]|uniref:Uncharacterized protein n=1 Tax=Goekera deserti TaxID=2497753 RepID=A0A7K3WA71_9ACTN|nr:hypothetical protein [Goekera deserti]MPQ99212.1 hypothetical protein [Goekera deserti]NDI47547.1 hypothetical protein [Goekera deserti]NEL53358.1 hypothetical protein [Goekera deserti]
MSPSFPRRARATARPRRRGGMALAAAALMTFAAVAFAAPASAAPPAPAPAPACPTAGGIPFSSTLSNGSFQIGRLATVSGASATACGVVTGSDFAALTSVVKKENVFFAPTTTKVTFLGLPTTVTPLGDLTGPASLVNGVTNVTLRGKVQVTTTILGSKCSFPLDLSLTTGTSGKLTGTPLVGGGTDGLLRGKVVANDFSVPKFQPSWACNVLLTSSSNLLLGLPLAPGASSISFDIALKLDV